MGSPGGELRGAWGVGLVGAAGRREIDQRGRLVPAGGRNRGVGERSRSLFEFMEVRELQ